MAHALNNKANIDSSCAMMYRDLSFVFCSKEHDVFDDVGDVEDGTIVEGKVIIVGS